MSQITHYIQTLPPQSNVGIDPALVSVTLARRYRKAFADANPGNHLVSVTENLVDMVWGSDQPPAPSEKAMVHPLEYSGMRDVTYVFSNTYPLGRSRLLS